MKLDPVSASLLCDHYGALLTENQRLCLRLQCDQDYSLAEIAAQTGVSRQGVHDTIARAVAALLDYEEKLGLAARSARERAAAKALREAAERVLQSCDESAREAARDILKILDTLEEA